MANRRPKAVGINSTKMFLVVAAGGFLAVALSPAQRTNPGVKSGAKSGPTFVDPTARVAASVRLGHLVYVAPFADIKVGRFRNRTVNIGNESNIQDSCVVTAEAG